MIIKPNILKIYCEYMRQGVVQDDWTQYEMFQNNVLSGVIALKGAK